jgi:hypothetical protein
LAGCMGLVATPVLRPYRDFAAHGVPPYFTSYRRRS